MFRRQRQFILLAVSAAACSLHVRLTHGVADKQASRRAALLLLPGVQGVRWRRHIGMGEGTGSGAPTGEEQLQRSTMPAGCVAD